jgi:CysZ protein
MIDDAIKALGQLFSPPLRAVLWKSIALALAVIFVAGIGLDRLIVHLVGAGSSSVETSLGPNAHTPVSVVAWLLSFAAGLGIIAGSVMLMPAVTAFVASFFADEIADVVEREHYPADPPGKALPLWRAVIEGVKTALLAIAVFLCALPLLLLLGFGAVIFFLATAYVLGRARRHALPSAARGEGAAQAQCRDGLYRRPVHRRLRLDPGAELGDAAVRHDLHGASAQAADGETGHAAAHYAGVRRKLYSITSSALANTEGGTVRPSALAVLRLTTNLNLVGSWIGSSPGFAPLRMRSA